MPAASSPLFAGCNGSAQRYDIAEMDPIARERLFGFRHAFDSPVTLWITVAVIAALLIASVIIWLLHTRGRTNDKLHDELVKRVVSWAVMSHCCSARFCSGRHGQF